MEWPGCNICGSESLKPFHSIQKNSCFEKSQWDRLGEFEKVTLVCCPKCKLVFTRPRVNRDSLISLYTTVYHEQHKEGKRLHLFEKRLECILSFKKTGKLLDVGCGYGTFLGIASDFFDVSGVEISSDAVSYVKKRYPFRVYQGDIESSSLNLNGLDIVTLWDVIEHLYDPKTVLNSLHTMLNENGLLAISTGKIGSLPSRLFGKRWAYYHYLDHVYFFSLKSLTKLLQTCRFEVLHWYTENQRFEDMLNFCTTGSKAIIKYLAYVTNARLHNKKLEARLKKLSRPLAPHFADLIVVIARKAR